MGLQNRDYFRADFEGGVDGSSSEWPMVKKLLIVTIVVFVLQILSTRDATLQEQRSVDAKYEQIIRRQNPKASDQQIQDFVESLKRPRVSVAQKLLELDTSKVTKGQIWRLVTYAFCHDTRSPPVHILFNMLGLWWFGRTLEQMYGSREFLWFYMIAAIVSGCAYVALDLATGQGGNAIGASGSVLAVMSLFAWHFPTHTIRIFFIIPLEVRWLVILYAVYDFHPVLLQLSGEFRSDGVAHAAHAGGLVFGFFYGRQTWRLSTRFEGWNWGTSWRRLKARFRPRPKLAIHRPNDLATYQSASARLDDVLAKISEQGEASLTSEERQFLIRESERIKRQR